MRIVTLISDFGTRDYRLGTLMGALYSASSDLHLAHVCHDIEPFDIDEAAFLLTCSYASFPSGTIHVLSVYHYYDVEPRLIWMEHDGHYFIGPDNGLFSLAFAQAELSCQTLDTAFCTGHYSTDCALIVQHLISAIETRQDIGQLATDVAEKIRLEPVMTSHELRGTVIRVDRYGNVLLNITRQHFEEARRGRPFSMIFNKHEQVDQLSEHYAEVDIGAPACRFGAHGYLEVVVRLQRADSFLGIGKGDVIQIKFFDL